MKRIVLLAIVAATCLQASARAQQGGLNTPVLPGLPADPADPLAHYKSDILEQRQVEPDILASTRNHLHLLAFFNDYRAVNLPDDAGQAGTFASRFKGLLDRVVAWVTGKPAKPAKPALPAVAAAAEARVGLSRSYDGGLTWQGGLLPKIDGLDAMTDPKSAAAPCGIGYVSLIAFTRGGESKVVVWRFQDRNNLDGGDSWVSQGYSIVEVGSNASNGHFHDLPAIAVDSMRSASADPCAHRVYLGWARFQGDEGAATLNFARTVTGDLAEGTSWAPTWDKKYVKTTTKTEQGITLAVDPRPGLPTAGGGGTVYYGWRVFQSLENPNGVWLTSSKDFGATFPKATLVTNGLPMHPFDQPTISISAAGFDPNLLAFRSNSLPTVQVGSTGTVFMAWQEKVGFDGCSTPINPASLCGLPSPGGEPRIVLTRSMDGGLTWTDYLGVAGKRRAVDFGDRDTTLPTPGFGYLPRYLQADRVSRGQVMPRLSFGGGRLGLLYFEARGPLTGPFALLAGINRQLDARYALLNPATGALDGTMQISRYPVKQGADLTTETEEDIAEVKPGFKRINKRVNAPNSDSGRSPFIGDYLGTTPVVQFVFDPVANLWKWALTAADVPFQGFQAVFADSRNQGPPDGATPDNPMIGSYGSFVPPGFAPPNSPPPPCGNQHTRNHDVMHALVDASVAVNAIATFKQLGSVTERAFPLTVTNGTGVMKAFQLTFNKPQIASFDQFDAGFDVLNVSLFPYSSATRVVYVASSNPKDSVTVSVAEVTISCTNPNDQSTCTVTPVTGGASGKVTLNLDPTNPIDGAADPNNPNNFTDEHTPLVSNPLVSNLNPTSPLVSNNALNPLVSNPLVSNSTLNPLVSNPLVSNPLLPDGTEVHDIIDTSWKVTGGGTVASAMTAAVNVANAQALTGHFLFQLVIHKTSSYGGAAGCGAKDVIQDQIISSIPNPLVSNPLVSNPLVSNPLVSNPLVSNATFALSAPGDGGGGGASLSAMKVTEPAVTPDTELQMDFKPDAVFVTLRAYQLSSDSELQQAGVTYDPTAAQIAVFPQSVDVVQGVEQGDEPPPAGLSFLVTNTNDSGAGSLRQAITDANARAGADNIRFLIAPGGPQTINVGSALPAITSPVVIDGTTQPGFADAPIIVLNGGGIGADGLLITSGSSVVRGLVIQGFGGNGIEISGPGGNLIEDNYIGTNAAGTAAQGNSGNGIQVIDSPNNTIGSASPLARNVIAGNTGEEVRLDGANATGNMIQGNFIGTNAAGTAVVSSSNSGVYIRKAPGNSVIGNVVSGNTGFAGIAICGGAACGGGPAGTQTSDAAGNVVQGNLIGTDASGSAALGNSGFGVSIDGAPDTLVGGRASGQRNVIAFNGLGTFQPGVIVFNPPASGNQIVLNSIHSNGGLGIDLAPTGLTQNDIGIEGPSDQDAGANGLQNFPELTSAVISGGVTAVNGTLRTTANTAVVIDLYSNTVCDSSGHGEGQTWFGSISGLVTNGLGNVSFSASIGPALPAGVLVTATATTAEGTSEFSGCRMALPPGFGDWPVFAGGNGHVYEYVTTPGTWTAAEAAARARSFRGVAGHLATIHSSSENTIITDLRGTGDMRGWIGLTDSITEGTFQWITGEGVGFTNWNTGEPNNQTGNEDYVEIFAAGVWNDIDNATPLNQGFVVEYPIDPTALVDSPPAPGSLNGDLISRGFYHPSYPGQLISTVRVFLSSDVDGNYTVSMTARAGAYDGPLVGTATATVNLNGSATLPTPVDFHFAPAAVTPGTLLTFSMVQVSPAPDGLPDVLYHRGACDFSAACPTPSPFKETEGTTAPLDTFRRNGVSAIIFDTRPLPPPILFLAIDGFMN
ncbi:MAG TPA: lectin-like protein [Vicinamibacterales bacterium]|nr:lectin-like protein [Vicinamibacterales bacterium]